MRMIAARAAPPMKAHVFSLSCRRRCCCNTRSDSPLSSGRPARPRRADLPGGWLGFFVAAGGSRSSTFSGADFGSSVVPASGTPRGMAAAWAIFAAGFPRSLAVLLPAGDPAWAGLPLLAGGDPGSENNPLIRPAGTHRPSVPRRTRSSGRRLPRWAIALSCGTASGPISRSATLQNHSAAIGDPPHLGCPYGKPAPTCSQFTPLFITILVFCQRRARNRRVGTAHRNRTH